ncbi:23S rRNA (guanosine(2251)-2'-O)-methyltransferase RlmB [candidate division KSB3 bacterium]|uniref:23S rRNA (Guanosine(2251)-2'-O)-methyltransferase RlmB n=1 Tax=candidate division KSB3 bacterium TaxID=2044937 RepID=A0A2G6KD06_9BACT|nr:MAG: 23S rRNA (guanosine(2251)-2'-O)-methyltransferase RlmB [candidate division KSB3 bacterium]
MSRIIFGIHPVQEALRSGQTFDCLYIAQSKKGKVMSEIVSLAKSCHIDVRFEPWERLTKKAGGSPKHQGVLGVLQSFSYTPFDELLSDSLQRDAPPFFLLLDGIQDPHNLGAILRSAECAGVHGVIIPKRKAAEVTPTVVKVSAGATAYIPVCRVTNMTATIEALQRHHIWVIGTSDAAKQSYTTVDYTMPLAFVIGNEEKGIRRLVAEKCDLVVSIPLYGKISSLNASVSSALMLFEVRRQRSL